MITLKKRLKKKLFTDKTYRGSLETLMRASRSRKVKKALIKSGEIKIGSIKLDIPYKDMI